MRATLTLFIFMGIMAVPVLARAEIPPAQGKAALTWEQRQALAKQFLGRIAKKLANTDRQIAEEKNPAAAQIARMPDGEELLFQVRLSKTLTLDAPVTSKTSSGKLLVSFRDLMLALEFPIEMDAQTGQANGWYIRESRNFSMDLQQRRVVSDQGEFAISAESEIQNGDIYATAEEIGSWFGLKIEPRITTLELAIDSKTPLPVEQRIARMEKTPGERINREPTLPRLKDENPAREYPLVDVSTVSSYTKRETSAEIEEPKKFQNSAFVRTSGDIAGGTLTTQSALDDTEGLTNVRATFSEQSLEPKLLGPLKARRYEIGDVYNPTIPLRIGSQSGLGARVTNAPANSSTWRPSTEIRGTAFPNWDVELYRGNQLVDIITVGDDGVYVFENVDLYSSTNNFRIVLYGPQGEMREEEISIPVDNRRLAESEGAYDISILAQDTQAYRKELGNNKVENEDKGATALTAIYEAPIGEFSAASVGFETEQEEGEQIYRAHAGVSTVLGGTLFNLDGAIDHNNETAAQLVARRDIGQHKLRNELQLNSEKFGMTEDNKEVQSIISNRFGINGPLPWDFSMRPRYNLGADLRYSPEGDLSQSYTAGLAGNVYKRLNMNQQFRYSPGTGNTETAANSITTLSGSLGRNRLRLVSNYEIAPDSKLANIEADYIRSVTDDIDFNLNVTHQPESHFTQGRAQMNWRAGFADISPSVSYNSDKDMVAMLNTRFGIARDPLSKDIKAFDTGITANGGISVFVYIDKNGNNKFDEGEEPVPDVVIQAPQNGGRQVTDETGHAFFSQLINMRPTDIYVDEDTLGDPYWISAYDGFSIVPREGHVTTVEFPVHTGGEIDGTVFAKDRAGNKTSLRGIILTLYTLNGKKVKSVTSESDGFYLIEKVPPGRYLLAVDNKNFDRKYARPKPQPILIKSGGSTMYGNNVYLSEGGSDVQVTFFEGPESLKIDPSTLHGRGLFLNLGTYKSRLSMGIAWMKVRNMFKNELKDMEILELPSTSLPDDKAKAYVLRVLAYSDDMSEVFNKCKLLKAHGQVCSVEVIPENKPETVALQGDGTPASSH